MFSNASSPDQRLSRYDHLIVHVTATRPDQDFDDTDIDRMHRARGFSGCGYNALIKRDGIWLDSDMGAKTRPIGAQGAHVGSCGAGWNGRSFGVSMVGGVDSHGRPEHNATDAQMRTLEAGIKRFLNLHPRGSSAVTVMGHRDLIRQTDARPKKACPCFDVIPWWQSVLSGPDVEPEAPDEDTALPPGSLVDQPAFWTVASGDTLSRISSVSGVTLAEIRALNPEIVDINRIAVGQVIRLQ
ncbi:N-acetylmuramoyl-L-alanine amidase [Sedimentitalea sp. HM32M-2]|uniref:N-acetylmuramoyl-L-alanine amidase n=1 Tax=Sedimentitalea sp. HM32M-2 TaxID=3351566 RepID=UPI0036D3296A